MFRLKPLLLACTLSLSLLANPLTAIAATYSIPLAAIPAADDGSGTGTGPSPDARAASSVFAAADPAANRLAGVPSPTTEMRGLWVASVANIDWPRKPTTDAAALRAEALETLDFARDHRFNAIFLQIRPAADSLFPSDFFPWSKYLTGTDGLAPSEGFDPLAFWLEEAHKRGLELHAWLNPYRITKKRETDPAPALESLPATHPARLHPDWVIRHSDGNLYFNPGLPEVRGYLQDSIAEVVTRYDVDGIHFDDYFYPSGSATKASGAVIFSGAAASAGAATLPRGFVPGTNGTAKWCSPFDDSAAFAAYGTLFTSVDDWRRENVNIFVREVRERLRHIAPSVRFGISPFAIWRNKAEDPLGLDTNGSNSYAEHAADTRKWVRMGWVDYIAPQIYWHLGYKIADYQKIASWWADTVQGTGVDLYFGQAAYRMDADDKASAFYGTAELEKQEAFNRANPSWDGSIFFSCQSFRDRPALAASLKAMREAEDGFTTSPGGGYRTLLEALGSTAGRVPVSAAEAATLAAGQNSGGLVVSRPPASLSTDYTGHYLNGASNPDKPLYLNGEEVTTRSPEGYFGLYVPLSRGKNTFVLSQEGTYIVRTIWRNKAAATTTAPAAMKKVEIPASSAYPQSPLYGQPGETYTLSCTAPIGAKVTVKVGGKTYAMTPAATKSPGTGAYPTTYRTSWKMPAQTGKARVVDAGAPQYVMTYKGKTYKRSAPAKIGIVMPGAPFYAEVLKDETSTYGAMNTSGGTRYLLGKGAREAVTGMVGDWVRLGSGQFIRKSAVKVAKSTAVIASKGTAPAYTVGEKEDNLTFSVSANTAVTADFDGSRLTVRVPLAASLALPALPADGLFETVKTEKSGSGLAYILTLRAGARLDGYLAERTAKGWRVLLKRHPVAADLSMPLAGRTILLDPGHGGTKDRYEDGESGAIGPLGPLWSERSINLSNAQVLKAELEKRGATVVMTRTDDTPLSLDARLKMSREIRPDLFISIHADSLDDNRDITKVEGFSVWYREPLAAEVGELVRKAVVDGLGRKDRKLNTANFYVVRGTWTPSILFEAGFVPNPTEFAKLLDPVEQQRMMELVAGAVAEYFSR